MQQQPPPPGGQRPESVAHIRPNKRSMMPVFFFGAIAIALIAAGSFAIYSFFFFRPELRVNEATDAAAIAAGATATPEVVKFTTTDSDAPAPDNPAPAPDTQTDAPAQPETPAETEPATDQPAPADNPPTETPVEQPPEAAPVEQQQPNGPAVMLSPDYGIQAFMYWRPEVAARDLQSIKDIQFNWVKQQIAWRDIEGAGKGVFDWSNIDSMMEQVDASGLNLIARVDLQPAWAGGGYPEIGPPDNYQDFVDFLIALTTRYQGRIAAYQIWNEPNLAREWGNRPPNPAEYTDLLRRSYEAIKSIDPDAYVITAGLAPTTRWDDVAMPDTVFVQGIYDAGAQPYFDMLGVNGAGFKVAPGTDPAVVANDPALNNNDPSPPDMKRIYAFRHVEDVRQIMVQNNDANKRVVVLEFGWSIDPRPDSPYYWHAVSEQEQAQYILQAYNYAQQNWQPWIGVMSLIYLANVDWTEADEQTYWSITYPEFPEFKARPAYWALIDYGRNRQ